MVIPLYHGENFEEPTVLYTSPHSKTLPSLTYADKTARMMV
jgi:hypothetical protein